MLMGISSDMPGIGVLDRLNGRTSFSPAYAAAAALMPAEPDGFEQEQSDGKCILSMAACIRERANHCPLCVVTCFYPDRQQGRNVPWRRFDYVRHFGSERDKADAARRRSLKKEPIRQREGASFLRTKGVHSCKAGVFPWKTGWGEHPSGRRVSCLRRHQYTRRRYDDAAVSS